jgi:hypothetical protein
MAGALLFFRATGTRHFTWNNAANIDYNADEREIEGDPGGLSFGGTIR